MNTHRKEHRDVNDVDLKECPKCRRWLPISDFTKDKSKWDGLYGHCKSCKSESDRRRYSKDPKQKYQKVLEYQCKTGLIKAYKPYNPAYYSSEKSRAKKHIRDLKRRELAKHANSKCVITEDIVEKVKIRYNNSCAYCGKTCKEIYQVDHKLPLSRGGGNEIDNLALSCPRCNQSKRNKTDLEFVGRRV